MENIQFNRITFPYAYAVGTGSLVLLSISKDFAYIDGKKTDTLKGYRYNVVELDNYLKFTVKIQSDNPIITNEQLENAKSKIMITFEDCMARPYRNSSNNYDLSFTATSISIIK